MNVQEDLREIDRESREKLTGQLQQNTNLFNLGLIAGSNRQQKK